MEGMRFIPTSQVTTTPPMDTANGYYSLYSNTTGGNNTASGMGALYSNTIGGNNTANGYEAQVVQAVQVEQEQ